MLTAEFFARDPVACARELVGAEFHWDGCAGRVVETEAYHEFGDEACHLFSRPGARAFLADHQAGTAYVYLNYGVHWLFNVLVKGPAGGGFVLIRALEPLAGLERMSARRGTADPRRWCAGPGCLTQAFGIGGSDHGTAFLGERDRGFRAGAAVEVVCGPRIGISRGTGHPWRFCEAGSTFLSRRAGGAGPPGAGSGGRWYG